MASEIRSWTRQGEAFWRAHHEAWKRSDLNQREYCEAEGIPLKAFGNWRAKFKAEPQPPERKLLHPPTVAVWPRMPASIAYSSAMRRSASVAIGDPVACCTS